MSCPTVSTKCGKVRGFIQKLSDKDEKSVYIYRNIPFAKPPVGELRFEPPQSVEPWSDIRDGTLLTNIPVQNRRYDDMTMNMLPVKNYSAHDMVTSEDCLYLSVYKPAMNGKSKLPVMVWIYGGGYYMGNEAMYQGTAIAGLNDVIVVVPNYRVSILGFLALGKSSQCPGNLGFLDQNFALQWVRENIENFGGDKDNVTIFGESAGGCSVDMHMLSPMSRGLFHKAISHSGQALMSVLFATEEMRKRSVEILREKLQISETDDEEVLRALKKIPAETLVKYIQEQDEFQFLPVVDGKFLTKTPEEHYNEGDFSKVPHMIGINKTEGSGIMSAFLAPDFLNGISEDKIKGIRFMPGNDRVMEECKKFYIKDDKDPLRFTKLVCDIIMDRFSVPAQMTAQKRAGAKAETYMYLGAFQLRMHHDENFGKNNFKKPDWCICDHTDDIFMMFGLPFLPGNLPNGGKFSEEEELLSRKCMTYITNFAKHGDPNKGEVVEVMWPKYNDGGKHIILDHPLSTGVNLRQAEFKLWSETIVEILKLYPDEQNVLPD